MKPLNSFTLIMALSCVFFLPVSGGAIEPLVSQAATTKILDVRQDDPAVLVECAVNRAIPRSAMPAVSNEHTGTLNSCSKAKHELSGEVSTDLDDFGGPFGFAARQPSQLGYTPLVAIRDAPIVEPNRICN